MNRFVTNTIRFIIDECIPPVIRDSKLFMYPFFRIWFKGNNIKKYMTFKSDVFNYSEKEFADFYKNRNSIATKRLTDLSNISIKHMLQNFDEKAENIIDIGCGSGYFLNKVKQNTSLKTLGCDIVNNLKYDDITFLHGNIENLPFEDKSFDIVTCHHTLEHVINLKQAISELKRVAKYQVIIVVPCQRYYYYTLDEHIWFFPYKELLEHYVDMEKHTCDKIWSDWVYFGQIE